jgi:hypothetical protein
LFASTRPISAALLAAVMSMLSRRSVSRACIEDLSAITIASWRTVRSSLEPAINSFKSLKRVEESETGVPHLIRVQPEQLHMVDGEPDALNSDAPLVRHLEFHRRGLPL